MPMLQIRVSDVQVVSCMLKVTWNCKNSCYFNPKLHLKYDPLVGPIKLGPCWLTRSQFNLSKTI